jgi:hypothetical protein
MFGSPYDRWIDVGDWCGWLEARQILKNWKSLKNDIFDSYDVLLSVIHNARPFLKNRRPETRLSEVTHRNRIESLFNNPVAKRFLSFHFSVICCRLVWLWFLGLGPWSLLQQMIPALLNSFSSPAVPRTLSSSRQPFQLASVLNHLAWWLWFICPEKAHLQPICYCRAWCLLVFSDYYCSIK